MEKFIYKVTDEAGLHARPAGILVKEARKFESNVAVKNDDKCADCKKLFSLMELMAKKGEILTFLIEGPDEQRAAAELSKFVKGNL